MITRSSATPANGASTSMTSGSATHVGQPQPLKLSVNCQYTYAKNMPIAPWAKLNTPVVVYTTTRPLADIAMMPATGNATTTRLVSLVPLTGFPAQAALLTS